MPFHDPQREIQKLRNHLASHDRPIAFLIGAGCSCAARDTSGEQLVPAMVELTERCAKVAAGLERPLAEAYQAVVDEIEADRLAGDTRPANIEEVLSSIRRKISAMATADRLAGVDRSQLAELERAVRSTIVDAADPAAGRVPEELPHHALARWLGSIDRLSPVELFTTNYDTLLERGMEDERVAVFDGFVGSRLPFFHPGALVHGDMAPGRRWVRLWKIHGSVNWARESIRGRERIVRRGSDDVGGAGELIFPSFHKYDESRKQPYVAMLDRLAQVLTAGADTLLVTIGYGWGDEHINAVLFDALEARQRMHIVSLQYDDLPLDHELMKRANRRHNLIVYGPTTAVVGGTFAGWRLLEPVDAQTAELLDVAFDSDADPDPSAVSLTGRFRLGDFVWFGRFLDRLSATSEP